MYELKEVMVEVEVEVVVISYDFVSGSLTVGYMVGVVFVIWKVDSSVAMGARFS